MIHLLIFSLFFISALTFRPVFHHTIRQLNLKATSTDTLVFDHIRIKAIEAVNEKVREGKIPEYFGAIVDGFIKEYADSSIEAKISGEVFQQNILSFLKFVQQALSNPHKFEPYHQAIRSPFDYYKWGNEFLRPLIILEKSKLEGLDNAKSIRDIISRGENVVITSNHQTEADPQVLSVLLEQEGLSDLAEKIIFIAGHKVTNDPVAIPFSMGRNLICIHSKKHIKNPPEAFPEKQAQNLSSMKVLAELVSKGGGVFWVAPSGGRDRPDENGNFLVAPFDSKSLDMFKMLAMTSGKPMHFFPMAMYTNKLVPPPATVSSGLGESRSAKRGPVSVHFLDKTPDLGGLKDKEFTAELQLTVDNAYQALVSWHATQ